MIKKILTVLFLLPTLLLAQSAGDMRGSYYDGSDWTTYTLTGTGVVKKTTGVPVIIAGAGFTGTAAFGTAAYQPSTDFIAAFQGTGTTPLILSGTFTGTNRFAGTIISTAGYMQHSGTMFLGSIPGGVAGVAYIGAGSDASASNRVVFLSPAGTGTTGSAGVEATGMIIQEIGSGTHFNNGKITWVGKGFLTMPGTGTFSLTGSNGTSGATLSLGTVISATSGVANPSYTAASSPGDGMSIIPGQVTVSTGSVAKVIYNSGSSVFSGLAKFSGTIRVDTIRNTADNFTVVDVSGGVLNDTAGSSSINFGSRLLTSGATTIASWGSGGAFSGGGFLVDTKLILANSGTIVMASGSATLTNANITTKTVFFTPTIIATGGSAPSALIPQVLATGTAVFLGSPTDGNTYNVAFGFRP